MRFGLDSTSMVPVSAHHAVGSTVALRYLSRSTSKVITKAEYEAYEANGIALYLVFEDGASNALGGYDRGKADAEFAVKQAHDILGTPSLTWQLPFAVDFDPTGRESQTDAYFDGVASVRNKVLCGPYGGYSMVAHAYERGFRGLWQTYAWSAGRFFDKAKVYQYSNDHFVAGVGTDFNHIFPDASGDFGQYNFKPEPPPDVMHYERYDKRPRNYKGKKINELDTVKAYDELRKHPFVHRAKLAVLREELHFLADRVYAVAHEYSYSPAWGLPPAWNVFHRGWRFQQLIHRAKGKKLTP